MDSEPRLSRLDSLLKPGVGGTVTEAMGTIELALEDEENFPGSINKAPSETSNVATLFCIVMDLGSRTANVRVGRPTEAVESLKLHF